MEKMKVHIGEKVRKALRKAGMSDSEFARGIGQARQNVSHILNRSSMDSELLFQISGLLQVDFFKYYSESLANPGPPELPGEMDPKELQPLFQELQLTKISLEAAQKEIGYLKEIVELLKSRT
jgi:transcriptional regulator with XRE-family HTH domain